jgi:hypothetical protein
MKQKNKFWNTKLFSIILTLSIIGMLLFSGPASAVQLKVKVSNSTPTSGEDITINLDVDLAKGERIPVENLVVVIYNTDNHSEFYDCEFSITGVMSGCDTSLFKSITANNNYSSGVNTFGYGYNGSNYVNYTSLLGYGYGYMFNYADTGYGELSYDLTFHLNDTFVGKNFSVGLKVNLDGSKSFETTTAEMNSNTFNVNYNSCTLDGVTIAHGASRNFFNAQSAPSCAFISRTCTNGVLSGNADYKYAECSVRSSSAPATPPPTDSGDDSGDTTTPTQSTQETIDNVIESVSSQLSSEQTENLKEVFETVKDTLNEDNVKDVKAIADKEQIKEEFKEALDKLKDLKGINSEDIDFVTVTESKETIVSLTSQVKENIKNLINDKLKELSIEGNLESMAGTNIQKTTKVTTFTTSSGETKVMVEVIMTVAVGDYIIEVPKNVAANTDFILGNYEIVEYDPIIMFKDSNQIKYSVITDYNNINDATTPESSASVLKVVKPQPVVEPVVEPIVEPVKEEKEPTVVVPPVKKQKKNVWPVILALVVVAGIVGFYFATSNATYYSKRAESLHKKADELHSRGNVEEAQKLRISANEYYHKAISKIKK